MSVYLTPHLSRTWVRIETPQATSHFIILRLGSLGRSVPRLEELYILKNLFPTVILTLSATRAKTLRSDFTEAERQEKVRVHLIMCNSSSI
jgi:hypothetical protein